MTAEEKQIVEWLWDNVDICTRNGALAILRAIKAIEAGHHRTGNKD